MIRTTISICALLGGLLVLSLVLREAAAADPSSTSRTSAQDGPQLSGPGTPADGNAASKPKEPARLAVLTDDRASKIVPPEAEPSRDQADAAELEALKNRVRTCLEYYYQHPEDANTRSPWGIMHALIAYGVDTEIYGGGRKVNAIGWLCFNGSCRGIRMIDLGHDGRLAPKQGPGVQGHHGQFLAMLAQSRVATDYPIKVNGRDFTVADLIEVEKRGCVPKSELTFKLIALSHYLPSDATWANQYGKWDIERLIREELAQPIVGSACGGTHRMMGFSYAVHTRAKRGEPITGQWKRAKKFVDDFHDYTFQLQNRDGSFSTNWFEGRGDFGDTDRRLQTTGHILEWMVYSLPEEQLRDRRVVRSVDFLSRLMLDNRGKKWEIGPKGHALHALVLYDQRVFGNKPGEGAYRLARKPGEKSSDK